VNLGIVVAAQFLLFFWGPAAQRLGELPVGIFAADHEANLTRWVGGDCGVSVLDVREDLLAILLELSDQWEMEPLILGCDTTRLASDSKKNQQNKEETDWCSQL
jgi:hypothetical protein